MQTTVLCSFFRLPGRVTKVYLSSWAVRGWAFAVPSLIACAFLSGRVDNVNEKDMS